MKKILQFTLKNPMLLVFLFITLLYGSYALGTPAEINKYAIVSAIGIDKVEDDDLNNFEISLLTFVPIAEQSFTETYKVISSKGRSVSEAMDFAGLHMGRQVGLSHVKLVVITENLLGDDITKFLDYLARSKHMSSSTKLVVTDSTAKDFLNATKKLDSESSIKVSELVTFNSEYIYAADSTFESFYKGLLGPTHVSFVPYLELEKSQDDGIAVSSSNSTGENDGNGQQNISEKSGAEEKLQIVNNGDTIIFKNGKEKVKIAGQDLKKINLIRGDFNTGSIEIQNYSDEHFDDVNLIFEIYNKKIKYKVVFENGTPVVCIDIKLTLTLSEVENKEGVLQENIEFFVITESETKAIEKKVRSSMADGIEIMRENQIDLIDFYAIMHNANKNDFHKFLQSLENEEDYLTHMVFKVSVTVNSK